jgi:flagellar secretion chaperone FliS
MGLFHLRSPLRTANVTGSVLSRPELEKFALTETTVQRADADTKRYQTQGIDTMFTSVNSRAAAAYKRIEAETSVQGANPHQLVGLLYDALLKSIATAKAALQRGDIPAKGAAIGKSVRIIEEGLKAGVNLKEGGEIASNLYIMYGYSVMRLTQANVRNDISALEEVARLIEPVAEAWKSIAGGKPAYLQPIKSAGA